MRYGTVIDCDTQHTYHSQYESAVVLDLIRKN